MRQEREINKADNRERFGLKQMEEGEDSKLQEWHSKSIKYP